jgi:predicted acetyltransferase
MGNRRNAVIELVLPSSRYRASYLEALTEYRAEGRDPPRSTMIESDGFDAFVASVRRLENPANVPPEFVQQTTWWLVERDTYLGRISIRHALNDSLLFEGGNIGYDLRPSARGRGLGTLQLALALPKAREIGLTRALLTCDWDNVRSARVIEANGGVLQDTVPVPGKDRINRRYWNEL